MAAAFGRSTLFDGPVTLATLFDIYGREVTPTKSPGTQQHDRACVAMFLQFLGAERDARSLNRRDWDRFIQARRAGTVAPAGKRIPAPVRNRQIEYDLRWLLAVLNWATTARDDAGSSLLERNPLRGLAVPTEQNPRRPMFTQEQYEALRDVAADMDWRFQFALAMVHETGHRIGAVRHLRGADLDLEAKLVRWAAEHDKMGFAHETPCSETLEQVSRHARRTGAAIGTAWMFPAPANPARPCSRYVMADWMEKALRQIGLAGQRYGWHSFRRKFATELKDLPLKDLCALGGWKDPRTILTCYQFADLDTMRAGLASRRPLQWTPRRTPANRQFNRQ
jgi:integrase